MEANTYNEMFELLYNNRKEDLTRAFEARKNHEKRPNNCKFILSYYKNKVDNEIEPLTEEELGILKETWKDIWDLGVIHPDWYAIHKTKTGIFDPTIIGTDLHYYFTEWKKIDYAYLRGFLDKNYGDIILPCIKHPKTYIRKIHGIYRNDRFEKISLEDAVEMLFAIKDEGAAVKVSIISSGGKDVTFISGKDTKDSIREKLESNRDITVQAMIKQHKSMEVMNPSSVNSVRTICIMLDGESIPLSTVVRIGKEGSKVDNFSSGGYACGVNPDGTLKESAFDSSGKWFTEHTNGFKFKDGKIPNFDKALEAVKKCHSYVPIFGVVSWDIAITEDGEPLLIEYNVGGGQIDLHQYCNGPVYGEYREQIIEELFSNYQVSNGVLDYNYVVKDKTCSITVGSKTLSDLVIPATIDDAAVKEIKDSAFSGNENLLSLTINAKLNRIGFSAFYNCRSLVSIRINDVVEEFGRSCFNSCSNLESIFLPEGTKVIETMAFRNCPKLKIVYIPDSVESIEKAVFLESPNVTILCKENSAAYHYAKENGVNFTIYSDIKIIGNEDYRARLVDGEAEILNARKRETTRIIPDTIDGEIPVTRICKEAFSGGIMKELILPDTLTTIGFAAFYNCKDLEKISMGKGVKVLKRSAFNNCRKLSEVVLPEGIVEIGERAFRNTALHDINIPDSVELIADDAFDGCSNLTIHCNKGSYAEQYAQKKSIAIQY